MYDLHTICAEFIRYQNEETEKRAQRTFALAAYSTAWHERGNSAAQWTRELWDHVRRYSARMI